MSDNNNKATVEEQEAANAADSLFRLVGGVHFLTDEDYQRLQQQCQVASTHDSTTVSTAGERDFYRACAVEMFDVAYPAVTKLQRAVAKNYAFRWMYSGNQCQTGRTPRNIGKRVDFSINPATRPLGRAFTAEQARQALIQHTDYAQLETRLLAALAKSK